MNYNILLLIQTIEFLKASSWVLSIIAIIISLISAIFVIVDKLKTWKELGQNKKLKMTRRYYSRLLNSKSKILVRKDLNLEKKKISKEQYTKHIIQNLIINKKNTSHNK